jgi:hypothetical protein
MTAPLRTPVIARHCAEKLLHMALSNQGDPLGYRAFGGIVEDADCETDQINFMDELAADALRGDQPHVVDRLMSWPTLRTMDCVTSALLRSLGILPEAALALSDALGKTSTTLEIIDGDDCGDRDGLVHVTGHETSWAVRIDEHAAWNSLGMVILPALPETARTAAVGMKLRDIVSHPVLDRFDLSIDRVTGVPTTTLTLVPDWTHMGRRDLVGETRRLRTAA